jgi:hypothetical protein
MKTTDHKLQGHTRFAGLPISIENKKGSTRSGVDANGKPWSVVMPFDYGYIGKTKGPDGDAYDCFIGPNGAAKFAYVVHQCKQLDRNKWDEDKVMLGFNSADAAIRAYRSAYNNVDLFHSMTVMPIEVFKKKVRATLGKKRQDKLHAFSFDYQVGDDYRQFREGTAIQPRPTNHPPSLKDPIDVPVENPDDEEGKKKRKRKANREYYTELARRQTGKPELVNTTIFVPLSQG